MWCERCQADVAAQASRDHQRLYCTTCGTELAIPPASPAPQNVPGTRNPRELLARWASEDAADPFGPLLDLSTEKSVRPGSSAGERRAVDDRPVSAMRIDRPHLNPTPPQNGGDAGSASSHHAQAQAPARNYQSVPIGPAPRQWSREPAHDSRHRQPPAMTDKSARWVALAGQMCAYLGVGTLTVGAVMVVVGHFGGPASYAPYGWLVTTAGQLLLFLGVVTLISGGLELTTQEVARKIEGLAEKFAWIEQTSAFGSTPEPPPPTEPSTRPTELELREQIAWLTRELDQRSS